MQYKICKTPWSKFRGLIFSKKKNLLFIFKNEKIRSFHMLFVFFPIDLIFLNKNKQIIEIKNNFMPFSFYTSKNKAKYVLESVRSKKFRIGQKLKI